MWSKHDYTTGVPDFPPDAKIKHPDCGWEGLASDLGSDDQAGSAPDYEDIWSLHICPRCERWCDPQDYLIWIEDDKEVKT